MRMVRGCMGLAALAVSLTLGAGAAVAADAAKGKQNFMKYGCWQCHGTVGQGSPISGPKLAPDPMPLEAMSAFIRNSNRTMPPYRAGSVAECGSRRHPRVSVVGAQAGRLQGDPAAPRLSQRASASPDRPGNARPSLTSRLAANHGGGSNGSKKLRAPRSTVENSWPAPPLRALPATTAAANAATPRAAARREAFRPLCGRPRSRSRSKPMSSPK